MVTTKWTCQKERSFAGNYFIFFKICFSLRTSYKELICCTNNTNAHICTYCECWSFIWQSFFPVSILKQTFGTSYVHISQKVKDVLLWNFQHIIFVWRRRYWKIFKSALVYLFVLFGLSHSVRGCSRTMTVLEILLASFILWSEWSECQFGFLSLAYPGGISFGASQKYLFHAF